MPAQRRLRHVDDQVGHLVLLGSCRIICCSISFICASCSSRASRFAALACLSRTCTWTSSSLRAPPAGPLVADLEVVENPHDHHDQHTQEVHFRPSGHAPRLLKSMLPDVEDFLLTGSLLAWACCGRSRARAPPQEPEPASSSGWLRYPDHAP